MRETQFATTNLHTLQKALTKKRKSKYCIKKKSSNHLNSTTTATCKELMEIRYLVSWCQNDEKAKKKLKIKKKKIFNLELS